jgi:hypothetical protein
MVGNILLTYLLRALVGAVAVGFYFAILGVFELPIASAALLMFLVIAVVAWRAPSPGVGTRRLQR